MNAISSLNSLCSGYAMWSAPVGTAGEEATAEMGPLDACDLSGGPDPAVLSELDGGDEFAEVAADEAVGEDALQDGSELGVAAPEEGLVPQAADINGEMWFFSAGTGDWGGLG